MTPTTSSSRATASTSASCACTRTASRSTCRTTLPWASSAAREGELVFVSGHPGGTERQSNRRRSWSSSATWRCPGVLLHLAELRGDAARVLGGSSRSGCASRRARIRTVENGLQGAAWPAAAAGRSGAASTRKRRRGRRAAGRGEEGPGEGGPLRRRVAWHRAVGPGRARRSIVRCPSWQSRGVASPPTCSSFARRWCVPQRSCPSPTPEAAARVHRRATARPATAACSARRPFLGRWSGLLVTFGLNTLRETLGADDRAACRRCSASEPPRSSPGRQWPARSLDDVPRCAQALWKGGKAAVEARRRIR